MASIKVGKTPRKAPSAPNNASSDPLQVYCRIRPMSSDYDESSCITVVSDTTIQLTPPDGSNPRYFNNKEVQYVFKKVFNTDVGQKQIYTEVAHPLVANLIHGKNGLLLTYGVTGSGKTYTMTGSNSDAGIMVRSIDVLFNSIGRFQPRKNTFKPDRMNGFEVQSQADILLQQQAEINGDFGKRTPGKELRRNRSDPDMASRVKDQSQVNGIDEDNVYSVFVSYIEIYNNSVHDLLEDVPEGTNTARIQLNNRLLREDGDKNMYVHGVNEIEVTTTEEAIQMFYKGLARKRMAKTSCNKESSRSHSVFIIRLVQAPLDLEGETPLQDKRAMVVSQLSLVDLAGSERSSRTQVTSGQRLREAGNINNSLMTLRTCLEILRENQMQSTAKIPPFRESKLTHLFKSYFTGEGDVRMIVCVNPGVEDYDENLAVMKFAEMSQEVQISKPLAARLDFGLTPGRRKINEATKKMREMLAADRRVDIGIIDSGVLYNFPPFPSFDSRSLLDDTRQKDLLLHLEARRKKEIELLTDIRRTGDQFRRSLLDLETTARAATAERDNLKNKLVSAHQKALEADNRAASLSLKLESEIRTRDTLEKDLERREMHVERLRLMKERSDEKNKATKTKLNQKFQSKMQAQADTYENKIRHTEKKVIRKVRNLIDSQLPDTSSMSSDSERCAPVATPRSLPLSSAGEHSARTTRSGRTHDVSIAATRRAPLAPSNTPAPRTTKRRSRSAGPPSGNNGNWLHHTPGQVLVNTPHGTVFQPTGWKKRKSVNALTDVRDIVDPKLAKYSLMTQEANTDGEMETHLFKGDVLQTVGGGAQVVFNELETLRQTSPLSSPVKHRIAAFNARSTEDLENRCQVGLEGNRKK